MYTATHEIYDKGTLAYLYDRDRNVVLTLEDASFYCSMSNEWFNAALSGKYSQYKIKDIIIELENK